MKYCVKCKVRIRSDMMICPLCQRRLSGNGDESIYPKITSVFSQFQTFFNRMMFITAAAAIFSVAINFLVPSKRLWSLYVILGLASFWIFLMLVIKKRENVAKQITSQVMFTTIGCVVWDLIIGWRGWSLNYIFPTVCVIAVCAMFILAKVMKLDASDYVVCIIANAFFGILPMVLYFFKLISVIYPSILGSALSLLALVSIIIFQREIIRLELAKRFHL